MSRTGLGGRQTHPDMAGDFVDSSRGAAKPALADQAKAVARTPVAFDGTALPGLLDRSGDPTTAREDYLASFAADLGAFLRAVAVVVHAGGTGEPRVVGVFAKPSAKVDASKWIPTPAAVSQVLKSGQSEVSDVIVAGRHHARFMFSFSSQDEEPLCVSIFHQPDASAAEKGVVGVARLACLAIARRDSLARLSEGEVAFRQATVLLEMVSRTAQADSFKRSLHLLAVELESFFDCHRVAIGTGSARFCQVHAVSGMNQADRRSLGHSQLASMMREAIALGQCTVWPVQEDLSRELSISANQDDLLHSFKAGRVLVVPLEQEEMGFRGAIALLWPQDSPQIPVATHRLLLACQPHLGGLVSFLDRTKPRAFRTKLRQQWRSGSARRAAIIGGAVFLVLLLLFPVTYRVPADCQVEPLLRRTIAAPFESRLEKSHVKPGDRVDRDQILAELDGREIRVALAEAIAARSAAVKKRDNAMVLSDPSSLQMAQLEADRLELEVQRLQFRSDNLIIRSPLAGVVLAGDLERSEGVPVSAGQKLFEVAPLEGMILEVSVPDREIRHVEPGMTVSFRLEAEGGRRRESQLESLHPAAEVAEGTHVFIAEAPLENHDGFLRPGMKGEARVLSGRKPVAWVFFHGLWEYLRLKLW
jgi:biotin carboxyl carrier protein